MSPSRETRSALVLAPRRVVLAAGGGSLAALVAASIDARWALDAAGGGASAAVTWMADVGLLAPLLGAVALGVGVALAFAVPGEIVTLGDVLRAWAGVDARRRGARVGVALLAAPTAFAWATLVAHVARDAFGGGQRPLRAGVIVAVASVGAAAMLVVGARALGRALGASARARSAHPAWGALVGAAVAALALGASIASGTTGGDGGALGIWGVLKRPELDLRGVALLGFVALGAAVAALSRAPVAVAAVVALAPFASTARDARALGDAPAIVRAIERGAPLGKPALALLRRLTDRDKDGASPIFGGGDCDDHDARVGPTAIDAPGNGIDEDCSGADAPMAAPIEPAAEASSDDVKSRIPRDLNVLLVTVDTLRADLGYMGNPRPVSPNLDALAAKSVVFERAYSLASYTGKSIGPLMCGKYPSETHRGWGHFNSFRKGDTMLAERLAKAGIRTVGVQAHWYFAPFSGIGRGFDVWDMSAQPGGGLQPDNDTTLTGERLTSAAVKQLSKPENTSSRFFAWVHYLDPHADYMRHPDAPDLGTGMRSQYDAEVWYDDREIGRLLAFVASQPWGAKTAVVVTSDHGEAFGEHHMIRHGFEVWEELVRVPLLVFVPGIAPHRVAARRSGIDLVPTVLELFGVDAPKGEAPGDFTSGRSLLDDVVGLPGHVPENRDVFVDMPAGPNNDERRAFYHDDLKLYVSGGVGYQLFDLEHDPAEKEDRMGDKELVERILPVYRAFKGRLREVYVKPVPKEEKTE